MGQATSNKSDKMDRIRVALLFGGPSEESGISLNSARSVSDHLHSDKIEILPIYYDSDLVPYLIDRARLYSNTPSDFTFKLAEFATALSEEALIDFLRGCDLAFPAIHGAFGEDGVLQEFLEKVGINFVGAPSKACQSCFDKFIASKTLAEKGHFTSPVMAIDRGYTSGALNELEEFFKLHKIKRAIVKPSQGGSSVGVSSVHNPQDALRCVEELFLIPHNKRVVIEPFCEGREFTTVILEESPGSPVSLLPVEVEMDYATGDIFDYRRKYLPTRQASYHCPARFDDDTVARIQKQAEELFMLFGMRDFARFDGWLLPDGRVWFFDFNPISGMEQNSFLFIQAARLGLSHRDLLSYVVERAVRRTRDCSLNFDQENNSDKTAVRVVFGGDTAERQVSVMSGTNVWLKLKNSKRFAPEPYFLDLDRKIWKLPYALALNHTAEDIYDACVSAHDTFSRDSRLRQAVLSRLKLESVGDEQGEFLPEKSSLEEFLQDKTPVFIGLHGGFGEGGDFQQLLEQSAICFNGSGSKASRLCMDKYLLGDFVSSLNDPNLKSLPKVRLEKAELDLLDVAKVEQLWLKVAGELDSNCLVVKPIGDGCSAGIVALKSADELFSYIQAARSGEPRIPLGTFEQQGGPIEMPSVHPEALLLEPFIETDMIEVKGAQLSVHDRSGWIELTVGVVGRQGAMRSLSPSITVAASFILSVEEKFQGGTGINITPPPEKVLSTRALEQVKSSMAKLANAVELRGYARIDIFVKRETGEVVVIEINTLPGLTPSTVIYHQALAENPPIYPTQFLEKILSYGIPE